ncbi:MAG: translation initiation factor IF-2 [Nitrososphaeria archaeon]
MVKYRQPIVVVLGHVDSGKTSLLDKIRKTAVQARESGGITQHIGASMFPKETLLEICGPLITGVGGEVKVPGILVIDTPGHEVFSNLRVRGGSAADFSIIVVDVMKGIEAQTIESLEILRQRRVPFVVALNKVDMVSGWRMGPSAFVTESLKRQSPTVVEILDRQLYTVVGGLSRLGFRSELYSRVRSFTKEVAIVPVSAKTGEGIPELLSIIVGLTQHYMMSSLACELGAPSGIILEVKEEVGLGVSADIILIDGILKTGDMVAVMKKGGAVPAKVKAILMPKPLDEMRDPTDKFTHVEEVCAAAGVKLVSPELEGVLPGSKFMGYKDGADFQRIKSQIEGEVEGLIFAKDELGLVVKADALGSLEAIVGSLKKRNVPIRLADIGPVSRRDVVEAIAVAEKDPFLGVILYFHVKLYPDAEELMQAKKVKAFNDPVIFNIIEGYLRWVEAERQKIESTEFGSLVLPCKIQVMKGYVFRRSNPAIFGVEVLEGRLKPSFRMMKDDGVVVGAIGGIQDRGKSLDIVYKGNQVAVSIREAVVGRSFNEGDILYSSPSYNDFKTLKSKYMNRLDEGEKKTFEEILKIKKAVDPSFIFL